MWNTCNCLIEHLVNKVRFRCRQGWQSRINYSPEQNNILYCLCMEYQGSSRSVRALCHSIILFHARQCRFMRGPLPMIPSFFLLFDFHVSCQSFVNYKLRTATFTCFMLHEARVGLERGYFKKHRGELLPGVNLLSRSSCYEINVFFYVRFFPKLHLIHFYRIKVVWPNEMGK